MKLDLHIHSIYSLDCQSSIEGIINTAKLKGLDGISVTDHNSFEGSKHAQSINDGGLLIIPGAEYSTEIGHLLVYFLSEGLENIGLKQDSRGLYSSSDIIGCAHEQQAIVFMAHPFQKSTDVSKKGIDIVDGIEVYNSRTAKWRNLSGNLDAMELAVKLHKPYTAGSDAHFLKEIGSAYIDIDLQAYNEQDTKLALINGRKTIWGKASSSINRPISQIIKSRRSKTTIAPKTLLKLGYFAYKEALLHFSLCHKPIEGRFILTDERVEINDII